MVDLKSLVELIIWVERLEASEDFVDYNDFSLLEILKGLSVGGFNKMRDIIAELSLCGKYYVENDGLNHPEYLYATEIVVDINKIIGNVHYRDKIVVVCINY
jgi:hypothetical protein